MRFIDLFAGLGGFHLALEELGHTCVFACDIEDNLRASYYKNFGIMPEGDIRKVPLSSIPQHDILCAGFPCQPFSKAGYQKGLNDKERGNLFFEILRIIKYHKPKYLLMENVPNIRYHDDGKTWNKIEKLLRKEGYDVATTELSPHHFGIPQIRLRAYIVGKRGKLSGFQWPTPTHDGIISTIESILDKNPKGARKLNLQVRGCLDIWQEFLDKLPKDEKIPLPLWSMEFGATYPYDSRTPHRMSLKELRKYKGSFGQPIVGKRRTEVYNCLPSHATRPDKQFPRWKINMIHKNREFYAKNKHILDPWLLKIKEYPSSFQKLEWTTGDGVRNMNKYILQCRPSGIRVKKLTTSPSLVAMNCSQIPIIPWEGRYITINECSRLQSMESLKYLPEKPQVAYKAFGNAINVKVVKSIANSLLNTGGKTIDRETIDHKYSTTCERIRNL
jgi:DNA (cytosine-5)-methyltransferase 1